MATDEVAACIADPGTLLDYMAVADSIVDEVRLHVSDNGWHVSAVDPANVAMIDHLDLAPRAFESFDSPGSATVGINLSRFQDYVGFADADQLVELTVNMETRKLEIRYGATRHKMRLIDPESMRKEPDSSDLDLSNTVTVEGRDFDHAVSAVNLSSDHVDIRGNVDDRQVEIAGQGDVDETVVEWGDDEVIDAKVNSDDESKFSVDYLEDMVGPIPADAEVTIRFDNEFPMRFTWEGAEGALDVQMTLAPRIKST